MTLSLTIVCFIVDFVTQIGLDNWASEESTEVYTSSALLAPFQSEAGGELHNMGRLRAWHCVKQVGCAWQNSARDNESLVVEPLRGAMLFRVTPHMVAVVSYPQTGLVRLAQDLVRPAMRALLYSWAQRVPVHVSF